MRSSMTRVGKVYPDNGLSIRCYTSCRHAVSLSHIATGYCCDERAGVHDACRPLAGNQAFLPATLWPRALLYPSYLLDPISTPGSCVQDQQALHIDPHPLLLLADGRLGMESRSGFPAPRRLRRGVTCAIRAVQRRDYLAR